MERFRIQNFGPGPRPFLRYFVTSKMGLARIYPYTKFEVSSFTRFIDLRKGFKIQFLVTGPLLRPFGGYFVIEMGLAKIYPYTKFEVTSFTRSKDTATA